MARSHSAESRIRRDNQHIELAKRGCYPRGAILRPVGIAAAYRRVSGQPQRIAAAAMAAVTMKRQRARWQKGFCL